jgi:hypothetical protein
LLQHQSARFAAVTGDPISRLRCLAHESPRSSALRVMERDAWQVLTWDELQRVVDALGHHLLSLGFAPGSQMYLAGNLSLGAITLSLASWSIGGGVDIIGQPGNSLALRPADRAFVYAAGHPDIAAARLPDGAGYTLLIDQLSSVPAVWPEQSRRVLPRWCDLLGDATSAAGRRPTRSQPAAGYWLEESSNDLGKLTDLIHFWLAAGIALSLPVAAKNHPARRQGALRGQWRHAVQNHISQRRDADRMSAI